MNSTEPATLTGLPALHTRWVLSELRVCNWGGFQGYVEAQVAHDATLVCGESGSGKSTLLDAHLLLLNPNGVTLNGASNAVDGRRTRRNPFTYTLGKYASIEGEDGTRVRALRGYDPTGRRIDTWSGVAAGFTSTTGDTVTVVRLFYATASAAHTSDLTVRFALYDGVFDLRIAEPFANARFPDRAMERALPGYHAYDNYRAFSEVLFRRLGIGDGASGANAVRLMQKVQSSAPIESVDRLYKDLVLDEPGTFTRADAAITAFEGLQNTYDDIIVAEQQQKQLSGISEHKQRYDEAAHTLAIAAALGDPSRDTPLALWTARHEVDMLQAAEDDASAHFKAAVKALTEQERRAGAAEQAHAEARDEWLRHGGERTDRLQRRVGELERTLSKVRVTAGQVKALLEQAGLSTPDTHEAYLRLIADAERFARTHTDAQTRLDDAWKATVLRDGKLVTKARDLDEQIRAWERTPTRVPLPRVRVRDAYAVEMGLESAELPFIAELIDMRDGQDDWRTAANAVMGGWAQNLVADERHRQELRKRVERHEHPFRLSRTAVTPDLRCHDNADTHTLAGKVIVKSDSAFAGWVRAYINRHFGYECVPGPDHLGTDGARRVTISGQTSAGKIDTHGASTLNVLGFSNQDLVDAARAELDQVSQQITAAKTAMNDARMGLTTHEDRSNAYSRVADTAWEDIDTTGVTSELTKTRLELSELQAADNPIAVLGRKVTELDRHATAEREDVGKCRTAKEQWERCASEFIERKDSASTRSELLEHVVTVTAEQQQRLDQYLTEAPWPVPDTEPADMPSQWRSTLNQVNKRLQDSREQAEKDRGTAERELTRAFSGFNERWSDPDRGDQLSEYDDFARILAELNHHDLPARKEQWARTVVDWGGDSMGSLSDAYRSTKDTISRRLDSINTVLHGIPFRDDHHRLIVRVADRTNTLVTTFLRALEALSTGQFAAVDPAAVESKFAAIKSIIDRIRPESPERDLLLDVRTHLRFTAAQVTAEEHTVVETFDAISGGDKSGGESQELIAFIVGAALRYQLGDMHRPPRFAPVVLDEAFIKADGRFASRGLTAWRTLGFQLIIGAPEPMVTALEAHVGHTLSVAKDHHHQSFVHIAREVKDTQA